VFCLKAGRSGTRVRVKLNRTAFLHVEENELRDVTPAVLLGATSEHDARARLRWDQTAI